MNLLTLVLDVVRFVRPTYEHGHGAEIDAPMEKGKDNVFLLNSFF